MPLLNAGNTQFSTSVTRAWRPHYKSRSLDRVEAALVAVQANPASGPHLVALYDRLGIWIRDNPKEFAARGSMVGQIAYEIERKAQALGVQVTAEAAQFRAATIASAALMWTPLRDLQAALDSHHADWAITVTDQPTGVAGVYQHTAEDRYALEDRAAALGELGPVHNPQNDRQFWLRLGRHVMTPRADGHRYGRCYSCAAAVIHTLVLDPRFDDYTIEHIAASGYDHHLVVVGRSNATGVSNAGLDTGWDQWKWTGVIVDAWQANLGGTFAELAHQNTYARLANRVWYCAYTPANRAADRLFATGLGPLVRVVAQPLLVAAARDALANQGQPTRQRRELRGGRMR